LPPIRQSVIPARQSRQIAIEREYEPPPIGDGAQRHQGAFHAVAREPMRGVRWLSQLRKSEPDWRIEPTLPFGNVSNGETFRAMTPQERAMRAAIHEAADRNARRLGLDRRDFLASAAGMATALGVISASACGSGNGSRLPQEAALDDSAACKALDVRGEFIFDIQTHHVNPFGEWRDHNPQIKSFIVGSPQAACGLDGPDCFSAQHYIEQIFLNSDTKVAVLSGVPSAPCGGDLTTDCGLPLDNEEIVATRALVNGLSHSQRLLSHCLVFPNSGLQGQLDEMERVKQAHGVAAWKLYPGWGPYGAGFFMDDPDSGIPVIEKGRQLGVKLFCAHKGLPLMGFDPIHNHPRDMAAAAKLFPDCSFIVYHSAINQGAPSPMDDLPEGPYDPADPTPRGINTLIRSLQDYGLQAGPGLNLYAETGGMWSRVMTSPDQAAHALGKLLKYFGPDNVVWGTDCIWTGSPQAQLEAFWAFQIGPEYQERYGYPALTDDVKRKILGLNAARLYGIDPTATLCAIGHGSLAQLKSEMDGDLGGRRFTALQPAGPRTRREFLSLARMNGHRPG
jgi:predicted TIM-barrel fold metal-dependent hydrolase